MEIMHAYLSGSQGADVVCAAAQASHVSRPRLATPKIGHGGTGLRISSGCGSLSGQLRCSNGLGFRGLV